MNVLSVVAMPDYGCRSYVIKSPYAWLAGATFLIGVGSGTVNPASRNAGLQLEPKTAPAIAAVRSMCVQPGRFVTVSIATATIANADTPVHIQAWIRAVAIVVSLAALSPIRGAPEPRGAW